MDSHREISGDDSAMVDELVTCFEQKRTGYRHIHVTDHSTIPRPVSQKCSTLTNPIHYLWAEHKFKDFDRFKVDRMTDEHLTNSNITWVLYNRLKPGLQLATLLLDRARPFLERVMFAPLVRCSTNNPFPLHALSDKWPCGLTDWAVFDRELRELSWTYRIYRESPTLHSKSADDMHWGATDIMFDESQTSHLIFSSIAACIFDVVDHRDWVLRPTEEQQSVLLVFAITLVHELTHALWMKRVCSRPAPWRDSIDLPLGLAGEPAFYPNETLTELGQRLELELFGGEAHNPFCAAPAGRLSNLDFSHENLLCIDAENGEPAKLYRLASETVSSMFQQETYYRTPGKPHFFNLYLLPLNDMDVDEWE